MSTWDRSQLASIASNHSLSPERVFALVTRLQQQFGKQHFYVFRAESSSGGGGTSGRPRQVIAFATPDTAFAFAQRNLPGVRVRVRELSIEQLIAVMLHEPLISSLIFVPESDVPIIRGQLPDGMRLHRDDLLRSTKADEEASVSDDASLIA